MFCLRPKQRIKEMLELPSIVCLAYKQRAMQPIPKVSGVGVVECFVDRTDTGRFGVRVEVMNFVTKFLAPRSRGVGPIANRSARLRPTPNAGCKNSQNKKRSRFHVEQREIAAAYRSCQACR